ncbi:helix-turn-helix domain-containing protein [uncultured Dysgonomonas sp.]|uniref:Helix-turn-helix domain-containing protein n=1 Tax=uncultured Dysgonomonas sp. TaxID=206096 RepID=A0A212IXP7_9BACT|nr:helix-turn-helix domain-containing protein [uncultured Dysgonomonas sp.]SBV91715.1 conserved hypothetical protein [uncultured Dysgonomonas sp.]
MNFDILLTNPELAKNIKFEITGENLLELSATLINASKRNGEQEKKESYYSISETCRKLNRTRVTLNKWHNAGVLKHNQIGLYKKSDIDKFLEKK